MATGKRILPVLLAVLALGGMAAGAVIYGGGWSAYFGGTAANGVVRVSGNIEVTDAEVSFKIPGRVIERQVDEGEMVARGAVVALLDKGDLEAELRLRQAELQAAQAALDELEAGSRAEDKAAAAAAKEKAFYYLKELEAGSREQQIASARAAAAAADAETARARSDLRRASQLIETKVIAQEDFDRVKTSYEVTLERQREAQEALSLALEGTREQQIEQARAALAQATAEYDRVMAGPRVETIAQARARVQQAAAAVQLAETNLGYATLYAPLSGVVLSKSIEPGEYVAPGTPVVTVGDLVNVWLRAYINETELGRVKVGQRVEVTTDTYPDKVYEGRVSFISSQAEFTPKNVQTQEERVKLVYRIKVNITNPSMELKPGMPADGRILLGGSAESESPHTAPHASTAPAAPAP